MGCSSSKSATRSAKFISLPRKVTRDTADASIVTETPPSLSVKGTDKGTESASSIQPPQEPISPSPSKATSFATALADDASSLFEEFRKKSCAENKVDEDTQKLLDSSRFCRDQFLAFPNDKRFVENGKSGPVALSIRPGNANERQVVSGRMSFGRGEFTIAQVQEVIMDIANKPRWDTQIQEGRVLKTIQKESNYEMAVTWAAYKKQLGVAGRTFLYLSYWEKITASKLVVACRSVHDEQLPAGITVPDFPTHLRGWINNAGYILELNAEGALIVTSYNQVDVGGSVPSWIVNKVQAKQPASLSELYIACKKKYKQL